VEPVRFRVALGALVGLYLLIELVYVGRLPLAMDEFQFASEIERLRSAVPYRDFPPYKNLLGFYLQSVPLAVGRWLGLGPWNDLILLKASMAIAVALTIFWIADRLRAFFDERSILQATALLVVMSTFLERSGVIRVEMLASLLGLGGALFLLRGRAMASGLLVGLAFLVTQKAIYFVLAVGAAFAFECLARRGREGSGRALLTFALSVLAPVVLYFGAFTLVAGVDRVWQAMFVDSSQVALWTDYSDKRLEFWQQTISRNPVFYLLGVAGIGCLLAPPLAARRPVDDRRRFAVHSLVLLALCLWLGWGAASAVRDVSTDMAMRKEVLTGLRDDLQGLTAEVAALRSDLAQGKTPDGSRIDALDARLATISESLARTAEAANRMAEASAQAVGDEVRAFLSRFGG